ncbi:MAG TPA: family 10 glycosylhydrolase [Candidatus Cloacimonadota bacterium]|nr:family 10 glycosylhydrolase [Candidatus Cloacimonadota bacterium]
MLFFILLLSANLVQAEVRALWVPIWEMTTAEQIDTLFSDLENQDFTQIMAQVRYRGDAAYKPNKHDDSFPNPEKRYFALQKNSFDPLEYLIKKAEKKGIEVHAWFATFIITGHDLTRLDSSHVYFQHPEWLTSDFNQESMKYQDDVGAFLDPGIPAVQNFTMNVILDVVTNYAIDGIHLDYVRYPGMYFGFNELAKQTYKSEVKYQDANSWLQWKVDQITRFVARVSQTAKEISPNLIVSAAVFPDGQNALDMYSQDWMFWLEKNYIDLAYTMSYTSSTPKLDADLSYLQSYNSDKKIVVGLRAWKNSDAYQAKEIQDKIKLVRKKDFAGFALFSYAGIKGAGYFKELKIKA